MHRSEQEFARTITSEHPPCSVGSMSGRGQTQHQHRGIGVAKAGHTAPPIDLVTEGSTLLDGNLFAPSHQPRAAPA